MATTYVPLYTTTLASATPSVTINSISAGYTDLVLVVSALGSAQANILIQVGNGSVDTGSNYSETFLSGNGSSATSARETNQNYYYFTYQSYPQSTTWNTSIHHFMNYANTTTNKTILSRSNNPAIGTDAVVGLWRSTSAINTIKIYPNTGNFASGTTISLYGVAAASVGAKATGGDVIGNDGTYYYHIFNSSGTFTPLQNLTADYLVIAGGGGGATNTGGGGAAGGLRSTVTATGGGGALESALALASGTGYTVTIGAGGATATSGSNSVFSTITSIGGGAGGAGGINGSTGGSGGGGGNGITTGGAGTSGQGFAGGSGRNGSGGGSSGDPYSSGGGGGSSAVGGNGTNIKSGDGGAGTSVAITGSLVTYAGGGGGGADAFRVLNGGGLGGTGGGGAGGNTGGAGGVAGTANTGGGGGGGANNTNGPGAAGGSGLVIVRYPI